MLLRAMPPPLDASPAPTAPADPDPLLRGRTSLGDLEILHCTDGSFRLDGGAMFGVVPKTLWQQRAPADDQNRILLGTNCAVVRTPHHTVLIETGIGNKLAPKLQEIFENQQRLPASLAAAGLRPEDISLVINTHLHFDHCGWNTTLHPDGQVRPTFPNARHIVAAGELAHAHRQLERDRVSYLTDNYDPLVRSGQLTALTDDDIRRSPEICPGIRLELFPGHTAHMLAVHLESRAPGGATRHACFIGDLIPTSAHLQPTWCMGFDLDPLRVIEERHRFLARAIPEDWLVLFPHDHALPAARLALDPRGRPIVRDPATRREALTPQTPVIRPHSGVIPTPVI